MHVKCILAAFFFICAALQAQLASKDETIFSAQAVPIWSSGARTIRSPDGMKQIVVSEPDRSDPDETHKVVVRVGGHTFRTKIGAMVNAEMGWSPDSKAFFITYSDGGNIGTYHVRIVYVTTSGLHVIEPVPNGRKLFKPRCFDPEWPNVGAIGWLGQDSGRLAIAVQVPPHSSCASMGTFRAFVLQLPSGRVVSQYNQIEAKERFSDQMASMLKDDDDECVRKPESCIPCGMEGGTCAQEP